MSHNKSTRRDFVKTLSGALGGVSLLGHGAGRGRALGSIPNSYTFYRILYSNEQTSFGSTVNQLGNISGSVMMAAPSSNTGIGYIYVHGTRQSRFGSESHGIFEVAVNFSHTPPVIMKVTLIAVEGGLLRTDTGQTIVVGHIGTGACNTLGEYVTTIDPAEPTGAIDVANSPGVYAFRPSGNGHSFWSRIIGFGDPVPDNSNLYGGDFGDLALDDDENLLLAAATTQTPGDTVSGFAGSQALIATSIGAPSKGRVVLQTGDMLPFGSAVVESVGLVDLAANRAFAAQVSARSMDPSVTRSGTALILGSTQAPLNQQVLVAASPEVMPPGLASQRNITTGQTLFGPRVDQRQDVAFVTHDSTFESSLGSNANETVGYYSRGSAQQLAQAQVSDSSENVVALGAPCIDGSGLMYGTQMMGDGSNRLYVSDGINMQVVLESRTGNVQSIPGRPFNQVLPLSEILFGQHPTQVDASGRLVFTAEFLKDINGPNSIDNVVTALVIGIPK